MNFEINELIDKKIDYRFKFIIFGDGEMDEEVWKVVLVGWKMWIPEGGPRVPMRATAVAGALPLVVFLICIAFCRALPFLRSLAATDCARVPRPLDGGGHLTGFQRHVCGDLHGRFRSIFFKCQSPLGMARKKYHRCGDASHTCSL